MRKSVVWNAPPVTAFTHAANKYLPSLAGTIPSTLILWVHGIGSKSIKKFGSRNS
ncbi:MAG: hypothetical protein LBC51_00895 [Treponema sp.]|nr:hypothetical protein [Treponema sp.]